MDKIEYYNKLKSLLEKFFGFEIKISEKDGNFEVVGEVSSQILVSTRLSFDDDYLNQLLDYSVYLMDEYYRKGKFGELEYFVIVEEICHFFIFNNHKIQPKSYENQIDFIQALKETSALTYENEPARLGIIIFHGETDGDISSQLSNKNIDFLPFDEEKALLDLINDKLTYKLIDGKSLSLVVNNNFEVVGLARKRNTGKSIKDELLSFFNQQEMSENEFYILTFFYVLYCVGNDKKDDAVNYLKKKFGEDQEKNLLAIHDFFLDTLKVSEEELRERFIKLTKPDFNFVEIKDRKINWHLTSDIFLSVFNNSWKYKDFNLFTFCIFELMYYKQLPDLKHFLNSGDNLLINIILSISKLVSVVKQLSEEKTGALFVILKNKEENEFTFVGPVEENEKGNSIPEGLLLNGEKESFHYKDVILNGTQLLNLRESDKYLIEVISTVDGAVLLDSSFNILSYGELINNNISQVEKPLIQIRGSRTAAAYAASYYGIAIKVSEDGNIDLWYEGDKLLSI